MKSEKVSFSWKACITHLPHFSPNDTIVRFPGFSDVLGVVGGCFIFLLNERISDNSNGVVAS